MAVAARGSGSRVVVVAVVVGWERGMGVERCRGGRGAVTEVSRWERCRGRGMRSFKSWKGSKC